MTDKQLLELAAKAYGFVEILFRDGADDDGYDNGIWTYTWVKDSDGKLIKWNPLDDDGDALRLAVKLGFPHELEYSLYINEQEYAIDMYAATRRAIVRAAAELGMKLN